MHTCSLQAASSLTGNAYLTQLWSPFNSFPMGNPVTDTNNIGVQSSMATKMVLLVGGGGILMVVICQQKELRLIVLCMYEKQLSHSDNDRESGYGARLAYSVHTANCVSLFIR